MHKNKIKAILYDLDGVLIDACDWHYHSLNRALKEVVGYDINREDHVSTFNGLPTNTKLDMLGVIGENAREVWRKKQDYTIDVIEEMATPMEEKTELHEETKSMGIKSCCVTNSINMTAELMLKKTDQLKYMDFIIANESVENNKPHPDCYLLAMSSLQLKPEECLIVEDSPKGLEAAYDTGAHVLEVENSSEVNKESIINALMGVAVS
tara:strand:- start:32153 stop:32779 length:627 start_codon:yes stop_codon:yes gene_type:complete